MEENDTTKKVISKLTKKLYESYDEIMVLKQTISDHSIKDVNQVAHLGKQVISLQLQVDKHKSQSEVRERERSFSRTIGKLFGASDLINV